MCPAGRVFEYTAVPNPNTAKAACSSPARETEKDYLNSSNKIKTDMKKLLFISAVLFSVAIGFGSCKAWRTISTTATYTQATDTSKVTTTIVTKTVEEYQGAKK